MRIFLHGWGMSLSEGAETSCGISPRTCLLYTSEAMMRNPETAYLVSNEEFDKQLEELGWSPGDMVTMAGMYIERGMYNMKKGIRDFFREILELMFQAAALVIDTIRTFFLVAVSYTHLDVYKRQVWCSNPPASCPLSAP